MAIKVCHMTSTHRPKDQRIFHKECISLAKAGYDVYLVEQGESEEANGVHIIGTGEQNTGRFYRLLKRPRAVYRLAKEADADIYHLHDMELLPYGMKLKRRGKKVIFDSHEDFANIFADSDALPLPQILRKLVAKIYVWYESHCLKRFDAVISVTPYTCDRLAKSNPNTAMVTNYPLLDAGAWKQDMQYHADSQYVAFAGQISDHYNVPFMVRAFQGVKGARLQLCGPLRDGSISERIKEDDVHNAVDYLGVLPYDEIPAFFNRARVSIVVPAYSNNTGWDLGTWGCNKLFESMLCAVPVVCTDYKLWKELMRNYPCGICVNPYDEKQLSDAVQYILDHPAEAEEMGEIGRKAVLEHYNWNSQAKVLCELYQKISGSEKK